MCGLVGIVALDGSQIEPAVLDRMLTSLAHRGPDHTGRLFSGRFALGHTRLSIIDVSAAAHQPFCSADGRWCIVYNGELYNFGPLRAELITAGRLFRTASDTEVVLQAFLHWGPDCLPRMNGMFAFVVADRETGALFAARDRLGIKPFHYTFIDGKLLFASEIKAIVAAASGVLRFDGRKLVELLMYRELIEENLLAGVQTLQPGHRLYLPAGAGIDSKQQCWFHVADLPSKEQSQHIKTLTRQERLDRLDRILNDAVSRHLVSDVPVGSLCSGGVDSSLMTAMACTSRPDVTVYHVDIADCSERIWAERVARHLGIDIHYFVLDREAYLARYVECIYYNDGPLTHPQNVPIAYISELAKSNGCKVLLAGEGADEGFGGYDWRYRLRWNYRRFERTTGFLYRLFRKVLFMSTEVWPQRFHPKDSFKSWMNASDVVDFCADQGYRRRLEAACANGYRFIRDPLAREAHAAMTADLRDYLGGILHQQDRASMQAGIESRVPFLDIEVIRFAANLPLEDKLSRRQSKRLLKELALRYLPHDVVHRTKVGFASPASEYVMGLGKGIFADGFLAHDCNLAPSAISELLDRDPGNCAHMLYGLELWGRMFIWGDAPAVLTDRLLGQSEAVGVAAVASRVAS